MSKLKKKPVATTTTVAFFFAEVSQLRFTKPMNQL